MDDRERRKKEKNWGRSRYNLNKNYKEIMTRVLPKYLIGKKKTKDRCLIARYRCGNELRGNQHWKDMADEICKVCEKEEENLIHAKRMPIDKL